MSFQAHGKQKEDGTDLGDGINRFIGDHQSGAGGSHQDSRQYFPHHRRQVQAFKQLTKKLGPDKDEEKLVKKWIAVVHEALLADFRGPTTTLSLLRCRAPQNSRVAAGFFKKQSAVSLQHSVRVTSSRSPDASLAW